MKPRSVIVIGAGVGGIAAAAHLAQQGMHVTVVEKNSRPGGRCDRCHRILTELEAIGARYDVEPSDA